jgi:hypothetical protein
LRRDAAALVGERQAAVEGAGALLGEDLAPAAEAARGAAGADGRGGAAAILAGLLALAALDAGLVGEEGGVALFLALDPGGIGAGAGLDLVALPVRLAGGGRGAGGGGRGRGGAAASEGGEEEAGARVHQSLVLPRAKMLAT